MSDEYDSMMRAYEDCEEQRRLCLRAVSLYDQAGAGYREILEIHNNSMFWHGFRIGVYVGTGVMTVVMFVLLVMGAV